MFTRAGKLFLFFIFFFITTNAFAVETHLLKFENNFSLILQKNVTAPLVAMQLWVPHGSTSETDREAGVAHFLEHLTFRSKDIAKRIESLGGDINAYTSFDKTVYHLTLSKQYWEEGLKVLHDILLNTNFDEKSFNDEKKVILEEMKRGQDSPQRVLYNLFFKTSLKIHPARRPVIGYEKTITEITRNEAYDFYKRFYTPSTSFLVVVGDIDNNLIEKAKILFGKEKSIDYLDNKFYEEDRKFASAVDSMSVNSCYLMLGVPTPDIKAPDIPIIDVISFIYGESANSILKEKLKEEKQIVNYVYSYQLSLKDMGFFIVQANFTCDKTDEVIHELSQLIFAENINYSDEMLKRVLVSYKSNFLFSKESFSEAATDLGASYFYYQDPEFSRKYIDAIKNVSIKDLERVRDKIFNADKATLVMITPDSFKQKAAHIIDKKMANFAKPANEIKAYKLKNGINLYINKNTNTPTFAFEIISIAGNRIEDPSSAGLTNFTISCLLRGTKKYSYKEIEEQIELMGGVISGYSTKNISGIKGKFLSENFLETINLIGDILINFDPPKEEIEKTKKLIISDIRKKTENPTKILKDLYFSNIYSETPLSFPVEGYEDSVSKFSKDMVLKHFRKIFNPSHLYIVFSGDLPRNAYNDIINMLEKLPISENINTPTVNPKPKDKIKNIKGDYNQTHIMIGFPVPGINSPLRPYLHVLSGVLSNQSGRLFTKLRDEEGLAYALGAFLYESLEASLFNLYIGTSPEKAERAKKALLEQLDKTLKEGILEEEKKKVEQQLITGFIHSLQKNYDSAALLANNALHFNDPLYYKEFQEQIIKIHTTEVTEKLKDFLNPENAIIVSVEGKSKH